MHKHVDQAPQDRSSIIGSPISSLAEKVQDRRPATGLLEFFYHPTQEHRFPFARIALDPEDRAFFSTAPLLKFESLQDPAKCIFEKTTFGLLDTLLVVAGVTVSTLTFRVGS